MKKLFLLAITIFFFSLGAPGVATSAHAQDDLSKFELTCPTGTSPIVGPTSATYDSLTGKMRRNLCVDANGNLVHAGNETFVASNKNVYSVIGQGAKGDARKVTDGVTNATTTVTSATAAFTSADVGRNIWAFVAANNGASILELANGTTITAVNSATSITVSAAAATSTTGVTLIIGSDDTAALSNTLAKISTSGGSGTVYLPCGNYVVTSIPFNDPNSGRTEVNYVGQNYLCTNLWLSQDFVYTATGGGQVLASNAPGSLENITIDALGSGPSNGNRFLVVYDGNLLRNFRVQNWGAATGLNNTCLSTATDNFVAWHPIVACSSTGGWQVQSLRTDIYFPDVTGSDYGINFLEQGTSLFGGVVTGVGAHAVVFSEATALSDINFYGTEVVDAGGIGFDFTGSKASARLFGVMCGPRAGQLDNVNMTCIKTAAGAVATVTASRLYANGTGVIYNNTGSVSIDDATLRDEVLTGAASRVTGTAPIVALTSGSSTSSATNFGVAIGTTTILTAPAQNQMILISFNIVQSAAGVGCSAASNTATLTVTAAPPGGSASTVGGAGLVLTITGNGTAGTLASASEGPFSFPVSASTLISYSTTSTLASTGCTTPPQYTVYSKALY